MALFLAPDLFCRFWQQPRRSELEIDRLTAIVGSEVTFENNAELDVLPLILLAIIKLLHLLLLKIW